MHFFDSLLDCVEKYLLEYDYLNQFKALMIEGIFGTIITSISAIICFIVDNNPFQEIIKYYGNEDTKNFILLLICLVLYFLLCGGRNAYRVTTNNIYSPMVKSLTDYTLNPLLIVYYFIFGNDFEVGGDKRTIYFIFNLILSIIIVFCALINNELIILDCCGLDYETHLIIAKRGDDEKKEDNLDNK